MDKHLDGEARAAVLARLGTAPVRLAEAATTLDAVDATTGPPPGEWTARQSVGHLCRLETEVLGARLDSLETSERPTWPWGELQPTDAPWMDTIESALAEFAARRSATLARLGALSESGWARWGIHETFGRLDVAALLTVFADHDDEHIAAILARAGIPPEHE